MKITAIFAYLAFYGGEKANFEVFKIFKKAGHDVSIILSKKVDKNLESIIKKENFKYKKINWGPDYIGFKNPFWDYFSIFYRVISITSKMLIHESKFKSDLIYVPNYLQYFYVWPYLFLKRKKLIFRIGDIPTNSSLHKLMWKYFINPYVVKFVCNSVISKKKLIKNIGEKFEYKIEVIRNINYLKKTTNLNNLKIKKNFICTYIGQINSDKGVHLILKSATRLTKRYREILFLIIGNTKKADKNLENLIINIQKDKNLLRKIKFKNYVNQSEIYNYYSKTDVLLVPSLFEDSSPNVIIEAQHLNIPVIGFKSGGIPELISHKKNGFICANKNEIDLSKAIEKLFKNENLYKKLCDRSLKSRKEFDNDYISKQWINLIV